MVVGELRHRNQLCGAPSGVDALSAPGLTRGRYQAAFAVSPRCIEAAQRLRFEVFNLELGEGLSESWVSGLDRDDFDDQMHHLVLIDTESGAIVGTYRLQTWRQAEAQQGLYSAMEYDLSPLARHADEVVELGRACIGRDHRCPTAITRLWMGIRMFLRLFEHRYLFGCCSITTTDPDDGWRALKTLRAQGCLHPELFLQPLPQCSCGTPAREFDPDLGPALKLPKLFRTYVRLGTQVISAPAVDREFGTVDFLVLLDHQEVRMSMYASEERELA
jgi:putative hemolysin